MKFKAQKALHKFQEADKKNPKFEQVDYAVFEKYDGWYGYYHAGNIYSRANRVIPSVQWLANKIQEAAPEIEGYLLFEILVEGSPVFSDLNGILNRKREPAMGAYLKVHDYIAGEDVKSKFWDRYAVAVHLTTCISLPNVTMAPILATTDDPDEWQAYAEYIWDRGGEGVILKAALADYAPGKRNYTLMKIKEELTLDLQVIGMYEGKGKYAGTLGGLIVAGKDIERQYCISGMTDTQRAEWWADESLIHGKVVEVKAMKKLKDGSLREPRFKAVRHDKTVDEID